MDKFPIEIMTMWLKMVSSESILTVYHVCREWRRLCINNVTFNHINMSDYPIKIQRHMVDNLLHNVKSVCFEDFYLSYIIGEQMMMIPFFEKFKNLSAINLYGYVHPLIHIIQNKNLTWLKLRWCDLRELKKISVCTKLTHLEIMGSSAGSRRQNMDGLTPIFRHCKLTHLSLHLLKITDKLMEDLSPTLLHLELFRTHMITDTTLTHITERCPLLTHFYNLMFSYL